MPLDRSLLSLVVSVLPRTNGKANRMNNAHLIRLKEVSFGKGFLVVALSGDGDNAYHDFLKPLYDVINSTECLQMTFAQIIEATSSYDEFFCHQLLTFLEVPPKPPLYSSPHTPSPSKSCHCRKSLEGLTDWELFGIKI
jgi:hypothetical protein